MSDQNLAWLMMGIGTAQVLLLVVSLVTTLRDDQGLQKSPTRPRRSDRLFTTIGVIMTALDDALARFTAFVKDVAAQLTGAKEANDAQTGKLAELQAKLDTALADDAADKAAIAALQAEIGTLQDEVAAKINAAVDAVANAPVADEEPVVVEEPVSDDLVVVEDEPVVEDSVATDTPADVAEDGGDPVQ